MNINVEHLKASVLEAHKKAGEYFSLAIYFNADSHSGRPEVEYYCQSYTPNSGHTKNHSDPATAIADTLFACSDPAKILNQARQLEEQARQLRARVKGAFRGCAACDRGDFQLGHADDCPKKGGAL